MCLEPRKGKIKCQGSLDRQVGKDKRMQDLGDAVNDFGQWTVIKGC